MSSQRIDDVLYFYMALLYQLAAKHELSRDDFYAMVKQAYDNLSVRADGTFWENICKSHNIEVIYSDESNLDLDDRVIRRLSDAIWLPFDQDTQQYKNNLAKE